MPKNNEKNVPETKGASGTKTETTEARGVDGSEIKGGPTTSDGTEGQTTETIATDVQTGKGSTTIGIAPNATTPTLLDERRATAVKRLAPKAAAVAVKDSNAVTTGETDSNAVTTGETVVLKAETTAQTTGRALRATTQISHSETPATVATLLAQRVVEAGVVATTVAVTNAAMTVETAGIEATKETTAPEAGVSRTEISTRTIGPVPHATTQISHSETPATVARRPAPAVVAVVAVTTVAVAAETAVAATTEATVAATTVASNETTAPTAVTVGHSDETTVPVAAAGASSAGTTGARLRTGRTDAHEENAQGTPTINPPETSGTTRRGNLTENETNEAVP